MARDPDIRFAEIAKGFLADVDVSWGKLFSAHGLRVRGRIFAMVTRGRLVVKLPMARVDALVEEGLAERFDPGHGRPMKEWASLHGNEPDWAGLIAEAKDFVGALG
jgi:TfoX/Sxy family transcriptional regulator of competence genes